MSFMYTYKDTRCVLTRCVCLCYIIWKHFRSFSGSNENITNIPDYFKDWKSIEGSNIKRWLYNMEVLKIHFIIFPMQSVTLALGLSTESFPIIV